jgi:hypothetical protein
MSLFLEDFQWIKPADSLRIRDAAKSSTCPATNWKEQSLQKKHCGKVAYNSCLFTFLSSNLRGDLQSASRNGLHQFFVNISFSHRPSWSYADGTQHEIIDQDLEVKGAIEVCQKTSIRALPLIRNAVENISSSSETVLARSLLSRRWTCQSSLSNREYSRAALLNPIHLLWNSNFGLDICAQGV